MMSEASHIIEQLNSPSDWFFIGGAAVAGFVLDGAINIIPVPFFSPGICGLAAGGLALTTKRGIEARAIQRRALDRRRVLLNEIERCSEVLHRNGEVTRLENIKWELRLNGRDDQKLEIIVREARRAAKLYEGSSSTGQSVALARRAINWEE